MKEHDSSKSSAIALRGGSPTWTRRASRRRARLARGLDGEQPDTDETERLKLGALSQLLARYLHL